MKWLGPTWVNVHLDKISHNLNEIRKQTPAKICGVIKGNGYGHGLRVIGLWLEGANLPYLAVSDLAEAAEIRELGVKTPILLLNPALPQEAPEIVRSGLTPTAASREFITCLAREAQARGKLVKLHLKIETGLNRSGIMPEETRAMIQFISQYPYLRLEGIYTHFAAAHRDRKYSYHQLNLLLQLRHELADLELTGCLWHCAGSSALLTLPQSHLDMVRIGTLLFGQSLLRTLPDNLNLEPTWEIHTRIIQVKPITNSKYLGYSRSSLAKKDGIMGLIPIGYCDGLGVDLKSADIGRELQNAAANIFTPAAKVYYGTHCFPLIGKISMNMSCIDLSRHPDPQSLYGVPVRLPIRRTTVNRRLPRLYYRDKRLILADWHNKLWQPFSKNNEVYLKEISAWAAKDCLKWRN